jgi:hypothetical protein
MASNSTTMKYLKTNNDEAESIILQQSVTPSNFDESSAPKRVSYGQYLKNNAYNSEAHSLISPSGLAIKPRHRSQKNLINLVTHGKPQNKWHRQNPGNIIPVSSITLSTKIN